MNSTTALHSVERVDEKKNSEESRRITENSASTGINTVCVYTYQAGATANDQPRCLSFD
jgi:hypothetical protein